MNVAVKKSPITPHLGPEGRPPRLGMIALATDLTSERDALSVIPRELAVLHVTRVAFANPSTPENLRLMGPRLTAAADLLVPSITLSAIYYSCTAASVVIGDAPVAEAIQLARPGVPVVTPTDAAVQAFAALGVRRIALVTPYLVETTAPMATYFAKRGLDLVAAHCLSLADDHAMARVTAASIGDALSAADCPEAEAFFVSCTALPALAVIAALEEKLGKPIVSSNQAGFWRLLHYAGVAAAAEAPGRLFSATPLETTA